MVRSLSIAITIYLTLRNTRSYTRRHASGPDSQSLHKRSSKMAADPNIELMGQKLLLPTSAAGVVGLCGVLAGVVLVVYFSVNGIVEIMSRGNPKNVQEVAALFVSKQITNTGGQPEVRDENTSKLIQFWSPSSDTKTDLGAVDQISADQSWQVT